jgi:predicted  nucleic acid-binding Zn-ribbon protein
MSGPDSTVTELTALEERIRTVTELVARLRDQQRALEAEREELRGKVRSLEAAVGKHAAEDWKPRIKALEQERTTLLDERRALARRVEEMLAKLAVLERAVHA